MRRSSPAPRLFVLALLRALHPDPAAVRRGQPPRGKVSPNSIVNRSPLTGGLRTDKGDLTGPDPGRSGQAWLQAAPGRRRRWAAVIGDRERGNATDSTMLAAVLDDIPAIRMPTGRRRRRPGKVHADNAYDHRRCRAYLRRRGSRPRIARRRIESSTRRGRHRWTSERTGAWLGGFRRLRIATGAPPNASSRWPCWPARSAAATPSPGRHRDRSGASPTTMFGTAVDICRNQEQAALGQHQRRRGGLDGRASGRQGTAPGHAGAGPG